MNFLNILAILAPISVAWSQTEIPEENCVVELTFTIREERIPAIVNYLLNNSLAAHDITTRDIIQLSKIEQYDLQETIQVFNYFNISAEEAFSVDNLENVLDNLGVEFETFYRSLKNKLNVSDPTIVQVLQDLSINQINFLMDLANQNYIYDTLREGNYSQEHVDAALQTVSKTGDEVFIAARGIILEKVFTFNSTEFMEILKENGWNRMTVNNLWRALNITTRDVYEVEKFRDLFGAISDHLNQNLSIAVFIDRNRLAVHEKIYQQFDSYVDGVTIKIEAGPIELFERETNRLGAHIVELTSKQDRDKYIEITEIYNATRNCTYITFINGELSVVDVNIDESFNVIKTDDVIFNVGSALICEGSLYGLAREEQDGVIIIDRFNLNGDLDNEEMESGENDPDVSRGNLNYSQMMLSLVVSLCVCFVLL